MRRGAAVSAGRSSAAGCESVSSTASGGACRHCIRFQAADAAGKKV